jgi:hypothetical protein
LNSLVPKFISGSGEMQVSLHTKSQILKVDKHFANL